MALRGAYLATEQINARNIVFSFGMGKWILRGLYLVGIAGVVAALPLALQWYEPIEKNNQALQALEQKQYDRAIDYLSQARQAKPHDPVIRHNLAVAYNAKAIALEQEGKEEDAIEYYERALELDPKNPTLVHNLVATLNNLAVSRSKTHEFVQAQRFFEQALRWMKELPDETVEQNVRKNYSGLLALWGAELLKANKVSEAAEAFRQALALNARNAAAMIYLGDIAYEVNDYTTARAFYSAARPLDKDNASYLETRLAMIEKEEPLEKELREITDRKGRFRLQYVPYSSGVRIQDVLTLLGEASDTLGRTLGLRSTRPINVKIYRAADFYRISSLPAWASGIYDGKMRLRVEDLDNDPAQVRDLLYHEYTHALLASNIRQPLPAWFHEGLAQLMEPQFAQSEREQKRVRTALADGRISFESLRKSFRDIPSKLEAEQAYLLSKYFLAELRQRHGEDKLRQWLALMTADENFEESFEQVYGLALEKAQEQWIAQQLELAGSGSSR